jgi:hypothetical protein
MIQEALKHQFKSLGTRMSRKKDYFLDTSWLRIRTNASADPDPGEPNQCESNALLFGGE